MIKNNWRRSKIACKRIKGRDCEKNIIPPIAMISIVVAEEMIAEVVLVTLATHAPIRMDPKVVNVVVTSMC